MAFFFWSPNNLSRPHFIYSKVEGKAAWQSAAGPDGVAAQRARGRLPVAGGAGHYQVWSVVSGQWSHHPLNLSALLFAR